MCSSVVEKPMRASGMEYDIDCWLFSPTPLLLNNYYNLLHVSQPLCGGSCITALFHTPQIESKVVTQEVFEKSGSSSLSLLGNYIQARQLAHAEAAIRGPTFLKTVQMKKLSCAVNSELLPRSPPYPEPFTRPIYLNWLSPTAGRTPRNAS